MARLTKERRQCVGVCGEMTWPAATQEMADLGYRLRYCPESITVEDRMVLAELVSAYIQMVNDPQKKRNAVCREIREASRGT